MPGHRKAGLEIMAVAGDPAEKARKRQHPAGEIASRAFGDCAPGFRTDIGETRAFTRYGAAFKVKAEPDRLQKPEFPSDKTLEPAISGVLKAYQMEKGTGRLEQGWLRLALGKAAIQNGARGRHPGKPKRIIKQQRRDRLVEFDGELAKLLGQPGTP